MISPKGPGNQRLLGWTANIVTLLAALPWVIFFGIPVLVALIAMRWHLLGGTLTAAGALVGLARLAQIGSDQWGAYLMLMVLLIGGALHIMAGIRQRSRRLELTA